MKFTLNLRYGVEVTAFVAFYLCLLRITGLAQIDWVWIFLPFAVATLMFAVTMAVLHLVLMWFENNVDDEE